MNGNGIMGQALAAAGIAAQQAALGPAIMDQDMAALVANPPPNIPNLLPIAGQNDVNMGQGDESSEPPPGLH